MLLFLFGMMVGVSVEAIMVTKMMHRKENEEIAELQERLNMDSQGGI